jgi:hypothetical protein
MAWASNERSAARGPGHIAPVPLAVTTPAPGDDPSVDALMHLSRCRYDAAGDTGKMLEFDTAAAVALRIYAAADRGEAITEAFIELARQGAPRQLFRQALGLLFDMDDGVGGGG